MQNLSDTYSAVAAPAEWYLIRNIETLDSPALVIYPDRVRANIREALKRVRQPGLLRPHIKTSKIAEVAGMMLEEGITKFKCATIAEAEMLARIQAPDVLLAYQPVGPKVQRLATLVKQYPYTRFSCLIDTMEAAIFLSACFAREELTLPVWIDLNVGMHRSGLPPEEAPDLFQQLQHLPALTLEGVHAYDGHIHDSNPSARREKAGEVYEMVLATAARLEALAGRPLRIVAGSSPTFLYHSEHPIECSPGTFVLWDWGYREIMPEEPYQFAALVITRVISIVNETTITLDLGHKAVAAENPLPRVHFLNAPDAVPVSQSEEHLVATVPDSAHYCLGDVLYGVPVHICPTVALYDSAMVVENGEAVAEWKVAARNRNIGV